MSAAQKKTPWGTFIGVMVLGLWLAVTLVLKYEPADTAFETAQVLDNNVLSEATETGTRFIYQTVFALSDGQTFKVQSPAAPPAVAGPVCAAITVGTLTGKTRYDIAATENCP